MPKMVAPLVDASGHRINWPVPTYAPAGLLGWFNPETGLYKSNSDALGVVKAGIARGATANATNPYCKIAAYGDSHTEAKADDTTGSSTAMWGSAWPDVMKTRLLALTGIPDGGTGWQKPTSQISTLDTRYWNAVSGTWTGRTGQIISSWAATTTAGNSLTMELAGGGGVAVDILTSKLNKPFTYTIYNSALTQIATGSTVRDGTSALLVTSITGLTDAFRLVITALTGTGGTWKLGPCQIRKASGLLVSNFALSNTSVREASPGFGWAADPANSSTYDWIGPEMLACVPDADMVTGTLGGNDFGAGGRTPAQVVGDMTIWLGRFSGATKFLVSNWWGIVDQSTLVAAYLTMCDTLGGVLLDTNWRQSTTSTMQARNLFKNSASTHPDEAAHNDVGRTVAAALAA